MRKRLQLPARRVESDGSGLVNVSPVQDASHCAIQLSHFDPVSLRVGPVQLTSDPVACQAVRRFNAANHHAHLRLTTATQTKYCWRPFRGRGGTNIDDLERPWNPKIEKFCEFFEISGCHAHLKSESSPKLLEMNQDNLRMKLNWCCRASYQQLLRFLVDIGFHWIMNKWQNCNQSVTFTLLNNYNSC